MRAETPSCRDNHPLNKALIAKAAIREMETITARLMITAHIRPKRYRSAGAATVSKIPKPKAPTQKAASILGSFAQDVQPL